MDSRHAIQVAVTDPSAVGEARRIALGLAERLKFGPERAGAIQLCITEAATNLVKHGKDGRILLQVIDSNGSVGMEALALDKGQGIPDLSNAMRDGFSTTGTPGKGLGAILRGADVFDIYSQPNGGTAVLMQWWRENDSQTAFDVGVLSLPLRGEHACGDSWYLLSDREQAWFMVVDGLGHGPQAAEAANKAVEIFDPRSESDPVHLLGTMHAALRSTRGAAAAVTRVNLSTKVVTFSGIGNISATLCSGQLTQSMVSMNGTLGHEARTMQQFQYAWPASGILVMHSDGLSNQWKFDKYPGLQMRHPTLIAGVILRDNDRGRDDTTVLVVKGRIAA